jgi:hypothetical protein
LGIRAESNVLGYDPGKIIFLTSSLTFGSGQEGIVQRITDRRNSCRRDRHDDDDAAICISLVSIALHNISLMMQMIIFAV